MPLSLLEVSKSAILAAGIACITAGTKLLETDIYSAIVLILVGVALIVIYGYLLEKQASEKAARMVRKEMERDVGERHCSKN